MVFNDISKFYETAMEQKKFSPEFFNELREISNETELKKFIETKVQPITKDLGYNFSVEDLLSYEKEITRKITEKQLENVSGGVDTKNWLLGGFISLMALGASAIGATNFASAELDSKTVARSTDALTSEIEKEISVPKKEAKLDGTNKTSKKIKSQKQTETESKNDKETQSEINNNQNNQTEQTTPNTDLETAKIATQVDQAETIENQKLTDDQKLYALQALNLQEAYALLQSGVIENLRLYGNVVEIETKDGVRQYTADHGDSFIELLFMLFPSNAGTLSISGGGNRLNFSKFGGISPELMAKFCAIANDYRNGKITDIPAVCKSVFDNKNKTTKDFMKIVEWLKNKNFDLASQIENSINTYLADYERVDSELKNLNNQNKKLQKDLDKIYEENNAIKDIKTLLNVIGKMKKLEKSKNTEESEKLKLEKESLLKKLNVEDNMNSIEKLKNDTIVSIDNSENKKQKIEEIKNQIQKNETEITEKRKEEATIKKLKEDIEESTKKLNFYFSFIKTLFDAINLENTPQNNESIQKIINQKNEQIEELKKELAKYTNGIFTLNGTDGRIKIINKKIDELNYGIKELEKGNVILYPKYLTEHILMAYMIKTLNTKEDVEKLYQELTTQLSQNESNKVSRAPEKIEKIKKDMEQEKINLNLLNEIINAAEFTKLSPYKNGTTANGTTHKISPTKDSKVKIDYGTFADCVDIALRHVINLLTYSNNENWDILLNGANIDHLNTKLREVVDAINKKNEVQFYDLKTRLQMFFLFQRGFVEGTDKEEDVNYRSKNGTDDVTPLARTLWEYVICNMDENNLKEGPDKEKSYYPVEYIGRKNYELASGYKNMLKLMWNIASALNLGNTINSDGKTKLDVSKENIDKMVSENNYNANLFGSAIKSTFELFHLNGSEIDIPSANISNYYGKVNVKIKKGNEKLLFVIDLGQGHGETQHNPVNFNWDDKFKDEKYMSDFGKLLLRKFTNKSSDVKNSVGFDGTFSGENLGSNDAFNKTDLYKKYKALSVFRALQNEEENLNRIKSLINSDVIDGAKQIKIKGEKTLADVYLERYLCPKYLEFNSDFKNLINEYFNGKSYEVYDEKGNVVNYLQYLKPSEKSDEVDLYLVDVENIGSELKIPSKIYDKDNKELKVVKVGSMTSDVPTELNTLTFEGDFEKLTINKLFSDEKNLTTVNFKGKVKDLTIGSLAFPYAKIETFEIPESVENLTIGYHAFDYCYSLKTFTVPESVKKLSINEVAFQHNFIDLLIPKKFSDQGVGFGANEFRDDYEIKCDGFITLIRYEKKNKILDLDVFGVSNLSLYPKELEDIAKTAGFNNISEIEDIKAHPEGDDFLINVHLYVLMNPKGQLSEKLINSEKVIFIYPEKFEKLPKEKSPFENCLYLKVTKPAEGFRLDKNLLNFFTEAMGIKDYSQIESIKLTDSEDNTVGLSSAYKFSDFKSYGKILINKSCEPPLCVADSQKGNVSQEQINSGKVIFITGKKGSLKDCLYLNIDKQLKEIVLDKNILRSCASEAKMEYDDIKFVKATNSSGEDIEIYGKGYLPFEEVGKYLVRSSVIKEYMPISQKDKIPQEVIDFKEIKFVTAEKGSFENWLYLKIDSLDEKEVPLNVDRLKYFAKEAGMDYRNIQFIKATNSAEEDIETIQTDYFLINDFKKLDKALIKNNFETLQVTNSQRHLVPQELIDSGKVKILPDETKAENFELPTPETNSEPNSQNDEIAQEKPILENVISKSSETKAESNSQKDIVNITPEKGPFKNWLYLKINNPVTEVNLNIEKLQSLSKEAGMNSNNVKFIKAINSDGKDVEIKHNSVILEIEFKKLDKALIKSNFETLQVTNSQRHLVPQELIDLGKVKILPDETKAENFELPTPETNSEPNPQNDEIAQEKPNSGNVVSKSSERLNATNDQKNEVSPKQIVSDKVEYLPYARKHLVPQEQIDSGRVILYKITSSKSWWGNWLYLKIDKPVEKIKLNKRNLNYYAQKAGFKYAFRVQGIQAINSEGKSVEIILDEDLRNDFENSKDVPGNLRGTCGKANLRKKN